MFFAFESALHGSVLISHLDCAFCPCLLVLFLKHKTLFVPSQGAPGKDGDVGAPGVPGPAVSTPLLSGVPRCFSFPLSILEMCFI